MEQTDEIPPPDPDMDAQLTEDTAESEDGEDGTEPPRRRRKCARQRRLTEFARR